MSIEITGLGINAGTGTSKTSNAGSGDFSAVMQKTALESRIDLDAVFTLLGEIRRICRFAESRRQSRIHFNLNATSPAAPWVLCSSCLVRRQA